MSVFPFVSYNNVHIPIVLFCGAKRVLFTNKLSEYWCHNLSLKPTCLSSFMHPSLQVRELHKHACPILMYGPKLFFVVFQTVRCLHKLIPCTSPNSVSLPSFICGCAPVSDIPRIQPEEEFQLPFCASTILLVIYFVHAVCVYHTQANVHHWLFHTYL